LTDIPIPKHLEMRLLSTFNAQSEVSVHLPPPNLAHESQTSMPGRIPRKFLSRRDI
jgi:hypothetical protein